MTYHGRVKNGVIVLDEPADLPDGAEVEVAPIANEGQPPTWAEIFKDLIGKAEGLPADASSHHDHYLYGVPKQ